MLTATMLAMFYIPFFFVLVRRGVRDGMRAIRERMRRRREARGMKRAAALIALLATGCATMEPPFVQPDPAIPPSWPVGDPYLVQRKPACRP